MAGLGLNAAVKLRGHTQQLVSAADACAATGQDACHASRISAAKTKQKDRV